MMTKWIAIDGKVFDAVPVDAECASLWSGKCPDCQRLLGEDHDPGCDRELCPRCGAQALSCDCDWEDRPMMTVEYARLVVATLTSAIASVEDPQP